MNELTEFQIRITCPVAGCKKHFGRKSDMVRHRKEVHEPRKQCLQPGCAYRARRAGRVRKHMQEKHSHLFTFCIQIPQEPGLGVLYEPPSSLAIQSEAATTSLQNAALMNSHTDVHQILCSLSDGDENWETQVQDFVSAQRAASSNSHFTTSSYSSPIDEEYYYAQYGQESQCCPQSPTNLLGNGVWYYPEVENR